MAQIGPKFSLREGLIYMYTEYTYIDGVSYRIQATNGVDKINFNSARCTVRRASKACMRGIKS